MVWIVAIFGIILFLYLRANTHTVEDARPSPDQAPGFGPQISLAQAAKGYFSHLISWLLVIAWTTALTLRIYVGQWSIYDLAIIAGILISWPLQEWFVHAQLEHFKPFKLFGRTIEFVITRTHRAHHLNPWDPKFGLSPPHIIRTWLYRRLWRHHRLHHFKNEEFWFGLTMLSGDTFMKTNPLPSEAVRSPTCLTLAPADGPLTESGVTKEPTNLHHEATSSKDA